MTGFWALLATALLAQDPAVDAARAMREGRFSDAERIYRQLAAEMPDEPRVRMNLALALYSGRKYADAAVEFQRFLKAQPAAGPAHLMLGVSQVKQGKHCEAVPVLETARKWRADAMVLTELADAYYGCKQYRNAGGTYQEAAKGKGNDPGLLRAAARAWWQAREYDVAGPLYTELAARFSTEPDFLYEHGDVLARVEGAEAGLPLLQQAVAKAPGLMAARGAYGRALLEVNRASDAVPHLEAAAPADATLLLPLSRAYRAVGRSAEAARTEAEYRKQVGTRK